jgi:propanediol utilization protein
MAIKIPVEVSARHVHLSQRDLETLFGPGYQFKKFKQLSQPSDFAAEEVLDIKNGENVIKKIRIVGPTRLQTQVEISITDAFYLGVNPPIRLSGDLKDSAGITLVGPNGELPLKRGLIIAARHLHCNPEEAKMLSLKDEKIISIKIEGFREVVFRNIKIRVGKNYKLCVHLDTDEGNAAAISRVGIGYLI